MSGDIPLVFLYKSINEIIFEEVRIRGINKSYNEGIEL